MGMPVAPTFVQNGWRGRSAVPDPTGINTAFNASDPLEDADWTQDTGVIFRVRIIVEQTNAAANTHADMATEFRLQYNNITAGSGWQNVGDQGTSTEDVIFADGDFEEGEDTTSLLDGGAGTFITGQGCEDSISETCTFTDALATFTELEFAIQILGANVTDGDAIDLRVLYSAADESPPATTMTETAIPTITANIPATEGTSAFTAPITTQAATGKITYAFVESSSDIPIATQAATGTATHESTSAFTIPLPTQAATGSAGKEGASSFTVPITTQVGEGAAEHHATAASTIPLSTQTGTGEATHESDSAAFTAPITTQTGDGTAGSAGSPTGTSAFDILLTTQTGEGEATHESDSSTFTAPITTQTGVGESAHESDSSAFDIPLSTQTGSGQREQNSTGANFDIPIPVQDGTGAAAVDPPTATSAFTIPLPEMVATGPFDVVSCGLWSAQQVFSPCDEWRVKLTGPAADNARVRLVLNFNL